MVTIVPVLHDIVAAVFNAKLVDEVFKAHATFSLAVLRNIFDKLVHSSIMRLNETSMNKVGVGVFPSNDNLQPCTAIRSDGHGVQVPNTEMH